MEENNLVNNNNSNINGDNKDNNNQNWSWKERREFFQQELNKVEKTNKVFIYKEDLSIIEQQNFKNYCSFVYNNKNNFNTYKKIVVTEILKLIATCIYVISLLIGIPGFLEKNLLSPFGIVYLVGFIIFILVGGISEIIYHKNYSYDNSYSKSKHEYFMSEYLKCKYEFINLLSLSEERINQIKHYLNDYYYHFSDKKKVEFNNTNKINNSYTTTNYIEKANKIAKTIEVSVKVYVYLYILFIFLFAVIAATIYI